MKTKQIYLRREGWVAGIRLLLLLLVSIVFTGTASAVGKGKLYAIKVYTTDQKVHRGVIKSADEKGIYLASRTGGKELFIDKSTIAHINARPKKAASTGLILGAAIGLIGGGTAVILSKPDDATETAIAAVGTAGLTFIGAALGGSIGSKSTEKIHINGSAESYNQNLSRIKSLSLEN